MILDTSAVIAILMREPEASALLDAILTTEPPVSISAGTALELMIVGQRKSPEISMAECLGFLQTARADIVPVDEDQVRLAATAFETFGRGRHPAGLNFGDCFAYALARKTGRPLLFKGDDFGRTDVRAVSW